MNPFIIFGNGELARVMYYYLVKEPPGKWNGKTGLYSGFTVEEEFFSLRDFKVLPGPSLAWCEHLKPNFIATGEVDLYILIGYKDSNRLRQRIFLEAECRGFNLPNFIHKDAYMAEDAKIGSQANVILEHSRVQTGAEIGVSNVLWSGVHIGHRSYLGNFNFISTGTVISGSCNIGNNCFFGINCSIKDNIEIADNTILGMGAIITKDITEPGGVYLAGVNNRRA